jgi:predicted DNA-binding ribbon-helix-helix protein
MLRQESGGNPLAWNPDSGASGVGQFIAGKAYDEGLQLHPVIHNLVKQKVSMQSELGKLYQKKNPTQEDRNEIERYKTRIANQENNIKLEQTRLFGGLKSNDPTLKAMALEEIKKDERFNQGKSWDVMKRVVKNYVDMTGSQAAATIMYFSGSERLKAIATTHNVPVKTVIEEIDKYRGNSKYLTAKERTHLVAVMKNSNISEKYIMGYNVPKIKSPKLWPSITNPFTPEYANR